MLSHARRFPGHLPRLIRLGFLLAMIGLGAGVPFLCASEPRDRHGDPLPSGAVARLGTVRFRVPDEIQAVAFAHDGKTLAVSSRAGLFLLDAGSGKRLRRLFADSRGGRRTSSSSRRTANG